MPIVTEIREQRGIIEILADGATVARVRRAHFARYPIREGDEIDPEAYVRKMASVQFADGYEDALASLARCARSARQIADSLRRRGYVAPVVEAVVARLVESGLINDADYARRMAELQSGKPIGVYAFKRKLRARGISGQDAEEALQAFDDRQQQSAALEAAQKLYRRYEALPQREARAKLSQALARRGFAWDAIESALDAILD